MYLAAGAVPPIIWAITRRGAVTAAVAATVPAGGAVVVAVAVALRGAVPTVPGAAAVA